MYIARLARTDELLALLTVKWRWQAVYKSTTDSALNNCKCTTLVTPCCQIRVMRCSATTGSTVTSTMSDNPSVAVVMTSTGHDVTQSVMTSRNQWRRNRACCGDPAVTSRGQWCHAFGNDVTRLVCRCSDDVSRCSDVPYAPVCASDWTTYPNDCLRYHNNWIIYPYPNECVMKAEACRRQTAVEVMWRGSCNPGQSPNYIPIITRESRMLRASLPSSGRLSVCLSVCLSVRLSHS